MPLLPWALAGGGGVMQGEDFMEMQDRHGRDVREITIMRIL